MASGSGAGSDSSLALLQELLTSGAGPAAQHVGRWFGLGGAQAGRVRPTPLTTGHLRELNVIGCHL